MRFRYLCLVFCAFFLVIPTGCSFIKSLDLPFLGGNNSSSAAETSQAEVLENPEYPVTEGGATVKSRPGKVVSLSPATTEKLINLNMTDRLVGVSDVCDFDTSVDALPKCGTALIPNVAEIIALSPHLVFTEAPLPEEALIELQQANIEVAVLSHSNSLSELFAGYKTISILMDGKTTGGIIGEDFVLEFQRVLDSISAIANQGGDAQKKVIYLRMLDFTLATGDTLEEELFELLNLENIASEYTDWQYPESATTSEAGKASFMAVDIIFCDNAYVDIKMLERSAFYKKLPAVLKDRYQYIDSLTLERQGLGIINELLKMASYVYPNADFSRVVFGTANENIAQSDFSSGDENAENSSEMLPPPEQSKPQ